MARPDRSASILNRDLGGWLALCFLSGGWGSNELVSIGGNSKGLSVSGEEEGGRGGAQSQMY